MEKIKLCKEELCTGCGACVNICAKSAIKLVLNEYGETVPVIDSDRCVKCKKCESVCPSINGVDLFTPQKCYAAHRIDLKNYARCAAGGIASLIMEEAYLKGWSVYGSTWDENLNPVFEKVGKFHAVEDFRGSRYVQTQTGKVYKEIRIDLLRGKSVVFVGMPCQIAGLKKYLNKEYQTLFCVDIFCHGVVPSQFLSDELKYLRLDDYANKITFRGYDKEEDYSLIAWNNESIIFREAGSINYYMQGFLRSITLRNSCYKCPYSGIERIGDISVGDFLGLKNPHNFSERPGNINAVLINSEKGELIFTCLRKKIIFCEKDISEAQNGGQALQHPAFFPNERVKFLALLPQIGYSKAIRRCLKRQVVISKFVRNFRFLKRIKCLRQLRELYRSK